MRLRHWLSEARAATNDDFAMQTLGLHWTGAPYAKTRGVGRAVKLQPYFQSGFPYDHDQWISASATGFAAMALAPAAGH